MRNTIVRRLIIASIVMAVLGVIVIRLFAKDFVWNYIVETEAELRYRQVSVLATRYSTEDYELFLNQYDTSYAEHSEEKLSKEQIDALQTIENGMQLDLMAAAESIDSHVSIVTHDGHAILSSNPSATSLVLTSFDIDSFGSSYYMITPLNKSADTEILTTMYPINQNYHTIGYVMAYETTEQMHLDTQSIMNNIYITFFIIYFLYIIVLVILITGYVRPIKEITAAAREYAKGNFTYDGLKNKHYMLEYQNLANSMNFMAERINDMDEYQKKFIANISHDFRSPLTSIRGYVDAILDGTIPPEMQGRYLNIVLNESERLTKMANSLISLNRSDTTGIRIIPTDFDLMSVIKSTLASFEHICLTKKIKFDFTSYSEQILVNGDTEKIKQVIYNLLDNALKFSPSGGTIYLNLSEKGEKVFISVKDFGIGIPKHALTKIWDRFYKTDDSRGKDKTGSGLGLAIVKEIIQAHKEQIDVISTQDVGTEFIFTMTKAKK